MSKWDHEADVVVVGSGGAALAAASAAVEEGAKVVMLEAAESAGGTTRLSGGAFWIPNNALMRAAGRTDARADALELMARLSYPTVYDANAPRLGLGQLEYDLLAAYYDEASGAIETLMARGAINAMILPNLGYSPDPLSDPDYHAELPENKSPYGRVLTAITPPNAFVWPGVYLADDLIQYVTGKGVPLLTGHRVTDVKLNGRGEVVGVKAEVQGKQKTFHARRGVVFASGGFAHDPYKMLAFQRGPLFGSGSVPTGKGDFLDIASRLGARIGNLSNGFYYQVVLEELVRNAGAVTRPDVHCFLPYGDSTVLVNKSGRRCVNEKAMYHVRAQSHFHAVGTDYPNLVQFMIWDQAVADEPTFWPWRGCVPLPGMDSPYLLKADTLEALAEAITSRLDSLRGIRSASGVVGPDVRLAPDFVTTLRETLERYNQFAASGKDEDFQRGETPIQQAWQGPSRSTTSNRTMYPISLEGPFYCMPLGAATLDTCGGPVIGPDARVLKGDGEAIPGLFGAGNCIASPVGQGYWGAGGTIGPALTFGYVAGRNAARESVRAG